MDDALRALLETDATELAAQWQDLAIWIKQHFGQDPTIEAILFLIGVQSTGCGYVPKLEKEAKQDLIMQGTYCALATLGLYRKIDGATNNHQGWERTHYLPKLDVKMQEKLLRIAILQYFDDILHETE